MPIQELLNKSSFIEWWEQITGMKNFSKDKRNAIGFCEGIAKV